MVAGLLATGDVGHLDRRGRLSIDGREDDMIVSGGENVFPAEVEELLAAHPAVVEVSVIGVPDDTYGQRLGAFVVRRDAGIEVDAGELKSYVHDRLAGFQDSTRDRVRRVAAAERDREGPQARTAHRRGARAVTNREERRPT